MKRILLYLVSIIAVLMLATMGLGAVFYFKFFPQIAAPDYPEPASIAEARLQDIDYLRTMPDYDNSFSPEENTAFHAWLDELAERSADMTDTEFALGVARAAAITDNGHSNMNPRASLKNLKTLPVRFFWFADGLYITRARASHAELIGARVMSYNAKTPEALVRDLDIYHGGAFDFFKFKSPSFFASPELMSAAGFGESPDRAVLNLQLMSGDERRLVMDAEAVSTGLSRASLLALPMALETEENADTDWVHITPPQTTQSYYTRNPKQDLWHDALPGNGKYIRMRWIFDSGETKLTSWLAEIGDTLRAAPADYLVIDLRSNYGGDYTQAMGFARNVDEFVVPGGQVYILTDGGTFSAAIVTAAFAKHAAADNGHIIGSAMGDYAQFWAEGAAFFRLPNSQLRVGVSTGYHDWENGCTDWSRCYWVNILLGVAAGSLEPTIDAPLTFEGYAQGRDDGIAAILAREGVL